jgi:chromosome segregation ATPase
MDQTSIEMLTHQLKRQISELKEKNEALTLTNERLGNAEFSCRLLQDEKKAFEREYSQKCEQQLKIIAQLRSEVDLLTRKLTEEETKNKLMFSQVEQMQIDFSRASEEKDKLSEANAGLESSLNELNLEVKRLSNEKADECEANGKGEGPGAGGNRATQDLHQRVDRECVGQRQRDP